MRIGFLTREYKIDDANVGGLGSYLRRITLALAAAGHEPHVFFYSHHPAGQELNQGVHIHRLNSTPGRLRRLVTRLTRDQLGHTVEALEAAARVAAYIRKIHRRTPLDILQSSNYSFLALFSARVVPTVIRGSSYRPLWDQADNVRPNRDRRLFTWLEAQQYRWMAGVFTPTQFLADVYRQELGLKDVRVIRTPFYNELQSMDDSVYRRELQGKPYLLFFGRLSPQKGAQTLAAALPQVWAQHPQAEAVFIGRDVKYDHTMTMTGYIRQICAGHEPQVHILSSLSHSQLYPIIANARLVVLPTFMDNAPNTQLEAMGFGRPVVGTYGTSMDEFIEDGVSGFLVTPGDPAALAEKINQAWEHPDLAQIGQNARDVVTRSLNSETILPQLIACYQEHAKKH